MATDRAVARRRRGWALACLAAVVVAGSVEAHEVRPAFLQLTEVSAGRFEVLWKQPVQPGAAPGLALRLPLEPRFPEHCREDDRVWPELTKSVLVERWVMVCGEGGLGDAAIEIGGLSRTLTDVLLRVRFLDGPPLIDSSNRTRRVRCCPARRAAAWACRHTCGSASSTCSSGSITSSSSVA